MRTYLQRWPSGRARVRAVLLTGAICSVASYIVIVYILKVRPTQVWLPTVGNVAMGTNEVSLSVAVGIATVSSIMALFLARTREEEVRPAHGRLEAYFQTDEASVNVPQIASEEDPVRPVQNGSTSASMVEIEEPEMDQLTSASKNETKWWINVRGRKHNGIIIGTCLNIDSAEKPKIEMYRFDNEKKIRALVIVGKEREVMEKLH